MDSAVSKLLDHLKGTREGWHPTTTPFPEVDARQLVRDLGLEAKGNRAADGLPVVRDHQGHDIVEREIIDDLTQRGRVSADQYATELNGYDGRMRVAAIGQGTFVMVKAAAADGLANFRAQAEEDRLKLNAEASRTNRVCGQFRQFVKRNRLEHVAPFVPHRNELILGWLLIAIIFIIETALNGMFFAAGSHAGQIGGMGEAAALSVLNMAVAAATGLVALRWLRHRQVVLQMLAALLLGACLVAALGLNVLIAHYREAFISAGGDAVNFRAVLDSVINAPLALSEARSWLLGAFGLVLYVVAAWKFHGLADPYPGYGRIAVRKHDALDQLVEVRRQCIELLTEHRYDAIDGMKQVVQAVEAKKHEYEQARRGRERLHQSYVRHLDALDDAAEYLGLVYHQAAGGGGDRTRLSIGLAAPELDPPVVDGDSEGHQRAIETMSGYIDQILDEYGDIVRSLPSVDLGTGTVDAAVTPE